MPEGSPPAVSASASPGAPASRPSTGPGAHPDAVEVDLLIVGAGFAGLAMLRRARQDGFSAVVLEAGSGVGGTWYWNRYPGARCDIESLEYSYQFDEELQQAWQWSERYATQPELLRYANHVADRHDLRRDIHLDTRVASARLDQSGGWQIESEDGRRWQARFLIMATGCLSSANVPDLPGLADFKGDCFHTGRWPHEPVDFSRRRVAVIGTGSSGIQSIPVIAGQAAHLTVFQRTATFTVPAHNGPIDPDYERTVKADYAGFRARNNQMLGGYGSNTPRNQASARAVSEDERQRQFEARWRQGGLSFMGVFDDLLLDETSNQYAAEFVRGKIRSIVKDPAVADLLSPRQVIGCKRLCVDTGYYASFNRPNVELVDIKADPIERLTATGLRTARAEYHFDTLVLATGFDAMTGSLNRIDIRGREGLSLKEAWAAGPRTYLGLGVAGFPNLFLISGPGSPSVLTNMLVSIEQHVDWIAECLQWMRERGLHSIEATPQAVAGWVERVNEVADRTLYPGCNSWYLGANVPGKPRVFMPLIGFPRYVEACEQIAADEYPGFSLA